MDLRADVDLEEYSTHKDCSLPPPYDVYSDNSLTRNTNPYKLQQEAAIRISAYRKKQPEVQKWEWILSSFSLFCCLVCGIPSIIFMFSACKDSEEGRTIETSRKLKYSHAFALVAIVAGIILYAASFSVVAIVIAIIVIRNTSPD